MFTKINLDYEKNLFPELETTVFETITNGRKGAVLVSLEENNSSSCNTLSSLNGTNIKNDLIPLVRTTTKYKNPVQQFKQIHYDIIDQIKEKISIEQNLPFGDKIRFNNALIEIYDNNYCTMGFHSDQALDLENESYIAIYSCYENKDTTNCRKLIIKNKITNKISEIIMDHNSVICFNYQQNQNHLHKIILENLNVNNNINNKWLGITFRLSKTFINHINNDTFFYKTNKILKLANDKETKEFYKLRSEENKNINFKYPEIDYTLSVSDLL